MQYRVYSPKVLSVVIAFISLLIFIAFNKYNGINMQYRDYFPIVLSAVAAFIVFFTCILLYKNNYKFLSFILGICGIFFIYVGFDYFNDLNKRSVYQDAGIKLMKNGKKITAQIIDIKHIVNINFNGRSPYVIIAEGENIITNKKEIFESYFIWDDILFKLQYKNFVDIYIDPENPKKYYMDLNSIR
jgi:glucan phosphoethanolaminetransferase (alkaline phosphatase superfamily)